MCISALAYTVQKIITNTFVELLTSAYGRGGRGARGGRSSQQEATS
jgi:hypothetical protein